MHFIDPENPDPTPLPAGATINADAVTVELNTVFQNLTELLQRIEPEKLNSTLGAISTALQGRGQEIGDLITRSHAYLGDINPSLPDLHNTTAASAEVTELYAAEVDNFLNVVRNTTGISGTIVEEEPSLDALLLDIIGLADTANSVVSNSEDDITTALSLLRPTTRLLDRYSPALNCIIEGLDNARPIAEDIFGGMQEGIALNSGFMYGAEPYTYPNDLPKVNAGGGPNCFGLPNPVPGAIPNYLVTDTANTPYLPSTRLITDAPRVYQIMFAGIPGVGE
ncbi:MCE family protein [Hoyosella altamirensis]|uniref:Phospholipid/cholesterol/gamma-HCH transport system substrate-binding protein n=1 Tax=Hoyosella altamirensis TaxID=616997 RepID=A0A839RSI3_9ACTN|nr:MCE family protein [Hoyosella altamirensis]MBB3039309.1 phospholipid/cholesterol/gamma-HCH transport system substrate-binding protein [Hoyosella altamirensis]